MRQVKDRFEKKADSKIDSDEVPNNVAVGFYPRPHAGGCIHNASFRRGDFEDSDVSFTTFICSIELYPLGEPKQASKLECRSVSAIARGASEDWLMSPALCTRGIAPTYGLSSVALGELCREQETVGLRKNV